MWELNHTEGWALKNWCFWIVVPWTTRRSNQSILKEINPGYSSEGLMLKLKLQIFGHLMRKADSLEKTLWCWERLKAEGEGDDRWWDGWMASPTQWTRVWANSRTWWMTGKPGVLQSMGLQRIRHDLATEQQSVQRFPSDPFDSISTPLCITSLTFSEALKFSGSLYLLVGLWTNHLTLTPPGTCEMAIPLLPRS